MRVTSLLVIILLALSSCSNRMVETTLYFGQSRPDGSLITEQEWLKFKNEYVLKVFKEGLTAIPVSGNWFDPDQKQMISEATYIIQCHHKRSAALSEQIDELREKYKELFNQQSVLRVDKKVRASF